MEIFISPQDAFDLVQKGEAILLDVREEEELESGIAEGALWTPFSGFSELSESFLKVADNLPKDKMIIVYCAAGVRAGKVAKYLADQENRTANMGGFDDWFLAGLPVKATR